MRAINVKMRKTKIVCTIGPATDTVEKIKELIVAGMDIARLNLSFGTVEYYGELIEIIDEVSDELAKKVAVLIDLPGPKIRIGKIPKPITLHRGERVKIVPKDVGEDREIPINQPEILRLLKPGSIVYLADGSIKLRVVEAGEFIVAEVLEGGVLASYKGVNIPDIPTKLGPITKRDREYLRYLLKKDVDWIAMSFVRSGSDVIELKKILNEFGKELPVIAKVERREAVENLESIVIESDGIMIARGDLGVELPLEDVPVIQKTVIKMAKEFGKPVITATQMLKSMVVQPEPTRAEVSDVANAVLDGSDALMLSEETATGKYPAKAVEVMDRIIRKAESIYSYVQEYSARSISESIASSSAKISAELHADAIITFTRSGASALQISKFRPPVPIIVVTHDEKTLKKLSLVWGCVPLTSVPPELDVEEVLPSIVKECLAKGLLKEDGIVVVTSGYPFGKPGTTNTLRVLKVKDVLDHPKNFR